MPLIKQCLVCKKDFRTKLFFIKIGAGKYCSKECHHKGLKKGEHVICAVCGVETYKSPKALRRSKSKKYFCGKSCQTKWRNSEFVGPKHANWQEGRYSYRGVLERNKVLKVCSLCNTKDERVLAGHHIDKDRTNNSLKNLAWLCHNCHFLVHHHEVERKKFMEALV